MKCFKHIRTVGILLATAITVISCTGCGGMQNSMQTGQDPPLPVPIEGEEKKIVLWTSGLEQFGEFFEALNSSFRQKSPGISIIWKDVQHDMLADELRAAVANGEGPDVLSLDTNLLLSMADEGLVADITDMTGDEQRSIYFEPLLYSTRVDRQGKGVQYGLPWYHSAQIMYYNTALFKAARISLPGTIDEALDICGEFYEKTGAYLFCPDEFYYLLNEYDINILDEQKKESVFNVQDTLDILERIKGLVDEGVLPALSSGDNEAAFELFKLGELAVIESSSYLTGRIKDEAEDIYGVLDVYTPITGRSGYSRTDLVSVCVAESSTDKNAAFELASFLTDTKMQLEFCKYAYVFPSSVEVASDPYFTGDANSPEGKTKVASAISAYSSRDKALGVYSERKIRAAINRAYDSCIIDGIPAPDALLASQIEVNSLISGPM